MPALVKDMGKAVPSFYDTVKGAGESVKPKLPLFAVLILGGVAVIFVLRNRSSSAATGPALTLNPSNESDVAQLDNMTQAILALTHQSNGGGATTPVTPSPAPPGTTPTTPHPTLTPPTPPIGSVTTTKLARLFQADPSGILRPVSSSSGSFTFSSSVGGLVTKRWTADTSGPFTTPVNTAQFRQITSGPHKGMYIRVTDMGSVFK